jgi:D-threo-aldose 1-dehydrogenase
VPNDKPSGDDMTNGFAVPDQLRRQLDYSADGVRRSIEESLTRLGLDRLDIALVHDPDTHVSQVVRETLPALVRLRDAGLIGAVGVGMNYWQPLERIARQGGVDTVMVAGRWTLLDRSAEPLLETCAANGVSVLAAAPYNSGILATPDPPDDARFDYARADPAVLARARAIAAACRRHSVSLPQAALQFPLRHPSVAAVVAGFANRAQVEEAAGWLSIPIPGDVWTAIEVDLPMPAGVFSTAPEQD